jgi:hypothetical protein
MLIRFPIPTVSTFSSKRSLSNSCSSSGKVKSRSIFMQHPSTSHPVAHSMEQFIPPFNQNRLPKEWWRTWRWLILMTRRSNQIVEPFTYKLQRNHTYTQSAANSHVLDKTRLRRHMLIWFPNTYCTVPTFSSKLPTCWHSTLCRVK